MAKATNKNVREDKFTWKKGDVQIYKSLEDFKKKNPNSKIQKARKPNRG